MKPRYGIDAPSVIRNLFLLSFALFFLAAFSFQIKNPLWFWLALLYSFPTALCLFATGCWMIYGTRIAKPKIARALIQSILLKGDEKILDLGCGRGMLLIEAAKCLPNGKAYGIDLWQKKDQSGNAKEATLQNAALEQVEEEIHTGDFRSLPFGDSVFDVVISGLAIHNVNREDERVRVLSEMLRVLKPGGRFALFDIHYAKQYLQFLQTQNLAEVRCSKKGYSYCPPIQIISGKKS